MAGMARVLLTVGGLLMVLGALLWAFSKVGLSRFPGDIVYRRGSFSFYAPLGLSVVLSVIATLLLNFLGRR